MRGSSQPPTHLLLHQLGELALGHHRVRQVQARELDLLRREHLRLADAPVVQRPVRFELQRADRMRDLLDRVRQRMRVVVHGIDAPRLAGAVVGRVADPVQHRVAHVHVLRLEVDLRAQHVRAFLELARAHAREQIQALCDGALAVRAGLPLLVEVAAVLADLFLRQAVDVRLALLDQLHRAAGTASRSSPTRRTGSTTRSRASGCRPGSPRRIRRLRWSGWCRRSAGCTCRRTPAPDRSRRRSPWRGRCAGNRSVPGGSGWRRGRRGACRRRPRRSSHARSCQLLRRAFQGWACWRSCRAAGAYSNSRPAQE